MQERENRIRPAAISHRACRFCRALVALALFWLNLAGCGGAGLCAPKEQEAFRLLERCVECGVISEAEQIYDSCAELGADLQERYTGVCESFAPQECEMTYEEYVDLAIGVYQLCERDCP